MNGTFTVPLMLRGGMSRDFTHRVRAMKELFRSNDAVYISFAQAVLKAEGIETFLLDTHMASTDGSIGALPRRLMVAEENYDKAKRLLEDAHPKE